MYRKKTLQKNATKPNVLNGPPKVCRRQFLK